MFRRINLIRFHRIRFFSVFSVNFELSILDFSSSTRFSRKPNFHFFRRNATFLKNGKPIRFSPLSPLRFIIGVIFEFKLE